MRKTTSHWLALLPLTLGLSLPTLLPVTLGVALWSSPALADKAAPFPIFNDNGGKRDRFQHLLFLAESAKDSRDRGRKYLRIGLGDGPRVRIGQEPRAVIERPATPCHRHARLPDFLASRNSI